MAEFMKNLVNRRWVPASRLGEAEASLGRSQVAGMMIIFGLAFSSPAHAVQPDEILSDAILEQRARDLSTGFRCLVCQNQSIDESDAPLAKDLRMLIREHLTKGDSDAEIKDFVVARYGEFVLLKPRFTTQTAILWATPFLIILAGFMVILRRRKITGVPAESALNAEEQKALRDLSSQ